jgi:hypothetical protein
MGLIQYYETSMFRWMDTGETLYQPFGRFGPTFRAEESQRRSRAMAALLLQASILGVAGYLFHDAPFVTWFWALVGIVLLSMITMALLTVGLCRGDSPAPLGREERVERRKRLRLVQPPILVLALPTFGGLMLGKGFRMGFDPVWWSTLGILAVVIGLLFLVDWGRRTLARR